MWGKLRYVKFIKVGLLLVIPLLLLATFVVLATGAVPYKVYVVNTGSITPTIPPGSAVIVHEGHYRIGQVVTFRENGLTVTHRLVSINAQGLTTTKGDANATADPWHVPKSQIVGGVVAEPRYLGYWITYLKSPLGLGSIVLIILVLWQVWKFAGGSSREVGGDEGGSPRQKRRGTRRKVAEPSSDDVATTPAEEFATQRSGHLDSSTTALTEGSPTVSREQADAYGDHVKSGSSVLTLIDESDSRVDTESTVDPLDDPIDQMEPAIAAEEQVDQGAVKPLEAHALVVDAEPSVTGLSDDSSTGIAVEPADDDDAIDVTSEEHVEPAHVEDEEQRRARMAKWFGVVHNGSEKAWEGRSK